MKSSSKWHEAYNITSRPTRIEQQQAPTLTSTSGNETAGENSSASGSDQRPVGRKQAKSTVEAKRKFQATIDGFVKIFDKRQKALEKASKELSEDYRIQRDFTIITTNSSSLEDPESRQYLAMLKQEAFVRIAARNLRLSGETQQEGSQQHSEEEDASSGEDQNDDTEDDQ